MKNDEVMDFSKMLDGLFDFYQTTIKPRKNKKWEYNGYDTTSNAILVTSSSVKQQLSKEGFEFRIKYRDDDPIKILLNAAIQLGIQQGINLCKDDKSLLTRK